MEEDEKKIFTAVIYDREDGSYKVVRFTDGNFLPEVYHPTFDHYHSDGRSAMNDITPDIFSDRFDGDRAIAIWTDGDAQFLPEFCNDPLVLMENGKAKVLYGNMIIVGTNRGYVSDLDQEDIPFVMSKLDEALGR